MTGVHTKMIEQTLTELLRETARAHFRRMPATDEELVALREQCNQLRALLYPDNDHARHPDSARLPEPLQLRLAAELAWIESSIVGLQSR